MSAPFAALEASVNRATVAHLANAEAEIGGQAVLGIFDNDYLDPLGMEASAPSFLAQAADLTGVVHGTAVTIGGVIYTARNLRPDGTGLTRVVLQEP